MGPFLESASKYLFMLFSSPADVRQVMHDTGTISTLVIVMLMAVAICYAVLYHAIDNPSFNKRRHLWMFISGSAAFVFAFALFYVPQSVNDGFRQAQADAAQQAASASSDGDGLEGGGQVSAPNLGAIASNAITTTYNYINAIPMALAAMVWTVVIFILVTFSPVPRRFSTNCRTLKIF